MLNIQKMKIMASGPINSWEIDEETMETVTDFIFLGSKISEHSTFPILFLLTTELLYLWLQRI